MKAIVASDPELGAAGLQLATRPMPQASINDVIVQVHAAGFVPTELAWPSTWTDRAGRARTPSIPGHELAGVVTALGYGHDRAVDWAAGVRHHRLVPRWGARRARRR